MSTLVLRGTLASLIGAAMPGPAANADMGSIKDVPDLTNLPT
jgi:hypothetical protein